MFSSVKLGLSGKLQTFILVNPLFFALKIVNKASFFITCNDILKKRVSFLLWKKNCGYEYVIFLILLIKSMRNPNAKLALFSFFFLRGGRLSMCRRQVLIHEYFSMDCILPILLKYLDERPGLGSSYNDASPERDFAIRNDFLATNTDNFRCYSSCIFVHLKL